MNTKRVAAVVPAAGQSSRFGSMKLLVDVAGRPLLDRTVGSLLAAGLAEVVVVVASDHTLGGIEVLRDPRVRLVTNADPSRGMFSSIQTGLAAASGAPVVIVPADMPFIAGSTIAAAVAACQSRAVSVVATHRGRRGHPLVLTVEAARAILAQPVGSNLKTALQRVGAPLEELDVDDAGVVRDVDVPADLGSET